MAKSPNRYSTHPLPTINEQLVDMQLPTSKHSEDPTSKATGVEETTATINITWKSLFNFTKGSDWFVLASGIVLVVISGGAKPVSTIFLGRIFDDLTSFGAHAETSGTLLANVSKSCLILTLLGLGASVVNSAFFAVWLIFGERQTRRMRKDMFKGMMEKEMEWFDLRTDGVSSLLVRIHSQIRELQTAASQPLAFFIEDCAVVVGALIVAFTSSWKLTLVILATIPAMILASALPTRGLEAAIMAQKCHLSAASKAAFSAIASIETVKAYNAQDHEVSQYRKYIKRAELAYFTQASGTALQIGASKFIGITIFVLGFWYGGVLVRGGEKAGSVLTTFYAVVQAMEAAEALLPQWLVLTKGISSGETLKHIMIQMENGRVVKKMQGGIKPQVCFGDIDVTNVSFSYPSTPNIEAVHKSTFFFPANEITFVIGRSGSGKSTLGNLLMKYYEPSGGQITIDGRPIQTLDLEWVRNNVTLVQQQSVLFNETLFHNIAFGRTQRSNVNKSDVLGACQTALLQETIHNLPDGLDTLIGSGRDTLSGGQKQRVSIARSKLKDSPILILDEATSALDPVSRNLVMESIREWRRGKTTIIITHDVSQILPTDFLYVLDKGQVIQEGFREALEKDRDGVFVTYLPPPASEAKGLGISNMVHTESMPSLSSGVESLTLSSKSDNIEDEVSQSPPKGLRRLSAFLGVSPASPHLSTVNRRTSMGMSTARMNDLRSETAWTLPSIPPLPKQYAKSLQKPNPAFLPPGSDGLISAMVEEVSLRRKLSAHVRNPSLQQHEDLELVRLMGDNTVKTRSGLKKLDCTTVSTSTLEHHQNHSDVVSIFAAKKAASIKAKAGRKPKEEMSLPAIIGTLWPILTWRQRAILIIAIVSAAVNAGCTPAFSYVLAQLLNTYYMPNGGAEQAKFWALITIIVAFADGTSSYLFHYCFEYCGQIWVDSLRLEVMTRILSQPRSWFDHPRNSPSALTECLDRNAEEMRNIVGRFVGYLFIAATMMTIAIVWAFTVCWQLSLVGLAAAPVLFVVSRLFETISSEWERRGNEAGSKVSEVFNETFSNIRVVRALTLENYFKNKHIAAIEEAYDIGRRRAVYSAPFFGLNDASTFFVTALVMYYGTVLAANGTASVPHVVLVITLLLFAASNATASTAFIPQIASSKATAARIIHLSRMPLLSSFESLGHVRLMNPFPIRFQNLSFTYPTRPFAKIVSNFNLKIEAGTCTAIVGSSGSGKSTLAALLLGLYPPSEPHHHHTPTLTFAGTSIFNLSIQDLRDHIAIVPQTPVLFPASIADNIVYGLPEHSSLRTPAHIRRAAQEAGIYDFIASLPEGYDTWIGEGGQGLSGGQAQRISIARALVRQPKILILDEATSALDVESARCIRDTIRRLVSGSAACDAIDGEEMGKRRAGSGLVRNFSRGGVVLPRESGGKVGEMAVVIITHSVEMMRVAERIVVLEKGRLVENGSWDELCYAGGAFQRLIGCGDCS